VVEIQKFSALWIMERPFKNELEEMYAYESVEQAWLRLKGRKPAWKEVAITPNRLAPQMTVSVIKKRVNILAFHVEGGVLVTIHLENIDNTK
jgi:hypothetical protein